MDLKTLCEINAPSGNEQVIRRVLMEEAKKVCEDVHIDRMGNLICKKPCGLTDAPHVALAAHMDEVGFIINGYTEDGLLRFLPIGGIDPRVIISKWLKVGKEELPGVIGAKAIHLQTKEEWQNALGYRDLYIDIGAKDKKEAESLVPLGSYASFDACYEELGDGYVVSKALDDRIGCYNLLRLLQNDYPCDLSVAFVVQEEVGLRGSQGAAHLLDPDIAIILEATAANDLGDTQERFHVCTPGKGVCVSFMDGATIADRELYHTVMDLAVQHEISAQPKRGITGGNDAGSFQRARAGCRTLVLSVPCRYIHSASSVSCKADIESQYQLADAFLQQL